MPAEKSDEQTAYEARLQIRLQILKKQFDAGKIRIAEGLDVVESLKRVRSAPDGTIDLSTVDGLVRSMALAVGRIGSGPTAQGPQTPRYPKVDQGFGR